MKSESRYAFSSKEPKHSSCLLAYNCGYILSMMGNCMESRDYWRMGPVLMLAEMLDTRSAPLCPGPRLNDADYMYSKPQ